MAASCPHCGSAKFGGEVTELEAPTEDPNKAGHLVGGKWENTCLGCGETSIHDGRTGTQKVS